MSTLEINGVSINFPFTPYKVQEDYMKKVIECLQDSKHGVLESPTGTGKTLCLLCSSLGWLVVKKAQLQAHAAIGVMGNSNNAGQLLKNLENASGVSLPQPTNTFGWGMPKIIYSSRTHSQLSQAMQELKRSSYKHVKVAVLGSRDQLCIHPEVSKEPNSFNKIQMCQTKVKGRNCFYYNNVEARKGDPIFQENILDIEDLVKAGQKAKCCPYFLTKEMKQTADIVFMPYNYLLDPKTRKAQGIELAHNIVLLDEAHNVEKTCEEAASLQISSTDIALCIEEITVVMKDMMNESNEDGDIAFEGINSVQKDFSKDDLCILKALFLEVEKAIDSIPVTKREEGDTFPGGYIFDLLEQAQLTQGKEQFVIDKLDKIILYLSTVSASPFARKGNALQKFCDLLRVVFSSGSSAALHRQRVKTSYKVHVQQEEIKKNSRSDNWEVKKPVKTNGKLISYWCFSPGFGMRQLLEQGVRSIILTSGTLSPLKPFISEIGIPIQVQLENPHIVTEKQVCVGVLSQGPDGHPLNSSFNTRNDPKYIASLGQTIYNFSCLLPHGLLVFFPSYPILKKCRDDWQNSGIWSKITERKAIFVEPQSRENFNSIMNDYYQKIQDPSCKGAIFMAVCRGKVSEGLDFANANGRAVLITGLPFPPLKDPRVILKQRYLEENRIAGKESLTGQQWYQLEASRAVNQAIGRIIRHKDDYGAIILCDCRFDNPSFKQQLSAWLRPHIKKFNGFGMVTKNLREFFKYAETTLPQPKMSGFISTERSMSLPVVAAEFDSGTKRILNTSSKKKTELTVQEEKIDLKCYLQERKDIKPKDFSALLEINDKPVINFRSCKLKEATSTCELTKISFEEERAPKRRKLRTIPMPFYNNDPSTSTSAPNDETPSAITPRLDIQANEKFLEKLRTTPMPFYDNDPSTSTSAPNNETPSAITPRLDIQANEKSTNKITTPPGTKNILSKNYVVEVRKALSKEDYRTFGIMVHTYNKDENFKELLKTLETLFLSEKKMKDFFIGFRSFLKKRHRPIFDEHVILMDTLDTW